MQSPNIDTESTVISSFLSLAVVIVVGFVVVGNLMSSSSSSRPLVSYSNSSIILAIQQKLGLWIDLTNTKRFYDRKEVESRECQYMKLRCRGHGETPSVEQTQAFLEIVDDFSNQKPLEYIGVHCTHGFNRTGFLIVAYMVLRLDCSVGAALTAFAKARPPGIYKQDYINELFQRYDDIEDAFQAPQRPDWCLGMHYQLRLNNSYQLEIRPLQIC